MPSPALKSCPFCGGEARIVELPHYAAARDGRGSTWTTGYAVECDGPPLESGRLICPLHPITDSCDSPESAAAVWNRRAGEVKKGGAE